jgi:hypothetical protein
VSPFVHESPAEHIAGMSDFELAEVVGSIAVEMTKPRGRALLAAIEWQLLANMLRVIADEIDRRNPR